VLENSDGERIVHLTEVESEDVLDGGGGARRVYQIQIILRKEWFDVIFNCLADEFLGKSVSSLAANSQRYSWRNQRSPMTRRSRARLAARMRGQSGAGTLMRRQEGQPSTQA